MTSSDVMLLRHMEFNIRYQHGLVNGQYITFTVSI